MATIDVRVSPNGKTTYRARARLKGYPQETASFTRKTDARKWAESVEASMREGRYFATNEARRHTFAELVDRYDRDILPLKPRNARGQRIQLAWWKSQLGEYRLSDVTPAKIAECRDRLLYAPKANGRVRSNSTAVRYLAALSHAFSVAMKEWGWIDDNPCRKVTKPREARGRVRFLDENERRRLLQACRESYCPVLYPITVLAISTGMRRNEMMNLCWPQVDLHRGVITLHETKNGDRRAVPLSGHALDELRRLGKMRRSDTDLLFPGSVLGRPFDITKAWRKAVLKAELEDFRFHDLRHTTASYLAQGGATPLEIAALLGHKTLAMVKRYAHLADSHVAEVVGRMNDNTFGKSVTL